MSDTWIIYGVQLLTIFVSSGLALLSLAICGRWWAGFQLKRNAIIKKQEPVDEGQIAGPQRSDGIICIRV